MPRRVLELGRIFVEKSQEYPRVSGFYKLIECVITSCDLHGFFHVDDPNGAYEKIEAEILGVKAEAPDENKYEMELDPTMKLESGVEVCHGFSMYV